MSNIEEWRRLAAADERATPDHQRTKGPVSTPAARVAELTSELAHVRRCLGEAVAHVERMEAKNQRFRSFQGVSYGGVAMAQYWVDFILWESALNENPQINAIYELGTWMGGFSWWLWGNAEARKIPFYTFDAVDPGHPVPCFEQLDIFAEVDALSARMRAHEPIALFCDNGNKPREMKEFAARLEHPETLFFVHDWMTEMFPADVPENLEEVYGDFCDEIGSATRVFRFRRL